MTNEGDYEALLLQLPQQALDAFIDVNRVDKNGRTALMRAAKSRYYGKEIVELFLAHKDIDVNCVDEAGDTALMCAIRNTCGQEAVELLLARPDIDVNVVNSDGNTALIYADSIRKNRIVDLLLVREEIDINQRWEFAVKWNRIKVVKQLLARNEIDVNRVDKNGRTALMRAAGAGHYFVVKQLLARDEIDVNCIDNSGRTALAEAVGKERNTRVVGLLLKHKGIDVNLAGENGDPFRPDESIPAEEQICYASYPTPLIELVMNYRGVDLFNQLLERKDIDVNLAGKDGRAALIVALALWDTEMVKLLLQHPQINVNLNVSIESDERQTPLQYVQNKICDEYNETERLEIVELLKQKSDTVENSNN